MEGQGKEGEEVFFRVVVTEVRLTMGTQEQREQLYLKAGVRCVLRIRE